MTILYITQNGIADHIGRAQVAPYLLGLAGKGFEIHLLSAEKDGKQQTIVEYERIFADARIRWTRVHYRNRPAFVGQAVTQMALRNAAFRIAAQGKIRLTHCRSFPAALIGRELKSQFGIKYIFDFRHFYPDGGISTSRGLRRLAFRYLKTLEGPLVVDADAVVCLTKRAQRVLTDWYFADRQDRVADRFCVVPCCADFNFFDPGQITPAKRSDARARADVPEGAFVLLYLGTIDPNYLLTEMLQLFKELRILVPSAVFLFVVNSGREAVFSEAQRVGVDASFVRVVSVERPDVPAFVSLADLSVMFIRNDIAHAGSSPTKLAEMLAQNIPIIANSGVGDVDSILDISQNGSVAIENFDAMTMRRALSSVLERLARGPHNIRDASREFDLPIGVERYARVYRGLLEHEQTYRRD